MYLKSYNDSAKTTVKSSVDFAIYDDSRLIMASLCDIAVNVKGVLSNLNVISNNKSMHLCKYDDLDFSRYADIYRYSATQPAKWQYQTCKNNNYLHGIAFNKELIKNTIIDYKGTGKNKLIAKFLNDKHNIPVTDKIVALLDKELDFEELNVYSKKESTIRAYYISDYTIKQIPSVLQKIDLPFDKSTIHEWDNIKTVNDYILAFNKPIQKKMNKSISVRFNTKDMVDMRMFDYGMTPHRGQVPLIQAGIETLKAENIAMYTCEMGTGKTLLGIMSNSLYMLNKKKDYYTTMVVVPDATVKKWAKELYKILGNSVIIKICSTTKEYIRFTKENTSKKPVYFIVSKETAKLGFKRIPAVNYSSSSKIVEIDKDGLNVKKKIKSLALCPKCGEPMKNAAYRKTDPIEDTFLQRHHFTSIKKSNYKCPNCGEVLWSASYDKNSKTSLMDYCHRKNIKFDSLIWDEFHNERSISSCTGTTFGNFLNMSKSKILLSGTMTNGNISSLFPLLMRLIPRTMLKDGYGMKDMDKFINAYGSLKAVATISDDTQRWSTRTMFKDSDYREIAGISPVVYTKYLSNICISATMDDLGIDMVDYKEYPIAVEMEDDLKRNINRIESELKSNSAYCFEMYNNSILRHYINNPFGWSSLDVMNNKKEMVTIDFPNLNKNITLKKEEQLLSLVKEKLFQQRKCLVYTDFTGGNSKYQEGDMISERLQKLFIANGVNAKILKASVKPSERMEYINKNSDVEVWITNPTLVKEGLDLIEFPTIIFYTFDYEPLKIQQAARRAWRSTQIMNCETYYFYYTDSVEEKVIKSVTLKKMEMNALEGKYDIDDFNLVKRTASSLGKELYDCINVNDSLNKLNENQVRAKNIKLHPTVEAYYKEKNVINLSIAKKRHKKTSTGSNGVIVSQPSFFQELFA